MNPNQPDDQSEPSNTEDQSNQSNSDNGSTWSQPLPAETDSTTSQGLDRNGDGVTDPNTALNQDPTPVSSLPVDSDGVPDLSVDNDPSHSSESSGDNQDGNSEPKVDLKEVEGFDAGNAPLPSPAADTEVGKVVVGGKSKKKLFTGILLTLVVLLLLAGGAALAYFQYYIPNKPENVLQSSILNTLQQRNFNYKGHVSTTEDKKAEMPALKVNFDTQSNVKDGTSAGTMKLVVSGVDFSTEFRYLEGNFYLKLGDLTTIKSLISGFGGFLTGSDSAAQAELESVIVEAGNVVSETWIEVDSTLLDQIGFNECVVKTDTYFNAADLEIIKKSYADNPFATIKSHENVDLDGKASIMYVLEIDNQKSNKFGNSLSGLSLAEKLKKCSETTQQSLDSQISEDQLLKDGTTELTVWVDKDAKLLSKVAMDYVKIPDSGAKVSADVNISYEAFTVEKPKDSRPAMQVWSDVMQVFTSSELFSPLLSGEF